MQCWFLQTVCEEPEAHTFSLSLFNLMSPGERKRVELLEAADEVGDSIHHLVEAVRANENTLKT